MSVRLEVEHTTTYRYARPVRFGPHRLLFRPRASHDIQVLWVPSRASIGSTTCSPTRWR
jgi:transglutaminase-like putative cysteine protease